MILSALISSFADLYRAKAALAAGLGQAELEKDFGYRKGDFRVKNALRDAGRFSAGYLRHALRVLGEADALLKSSRLDAQTNKDFDVVFALWSPDYNDALTYLDMWMTNNGNNHTGWGSEEYDELINQAFAEADTQAHRDLLVQAETLLMEEMPIGPIYFRTRDYICSDKLTGVVRNAFQDMLLTYATINA